MSERESDKQHQELVQPLLKALSEIPTDSVDEIEKAVATMSKLSVAAYFRARGINQAESAMLNVLLSAPSHEVPPVGWKLVPLELTEPMRVAGYLYKDKLGARALYRALLDAAPQASANPSEDHREGGPDTDVTQEDAKPGNAGACGAAPLSSIATPDADGNDPIVSAYLEKEARNCEDIDRDLNKPIMALRARVSATRPSIPAPLFDGYAVYEAMGKPVDVSPHNVAAVLDAVVRLIRAEGK